MVRESSTSEQIGQDVSAAVVAMQFQDLTQQRLENICGAIGNLLVAAADLRAQSDNNNGLAAAADAAPCPTGSSG